MGVGVGAVLILPALLSARLALLRVECFDRSSGCWLVLIQCLTIALCYCSVSVAVTDLGADVPGDEAYYYFWI